MKCALVWEGSSFPRNEAPLAVSISILAHFCHKMHDVVYSEAKFNSKGELRYHAAIWQQWWLMG